MRSYRLETDLECPHCYEASDKVVIHFRLPVDIDVVVTCHICGGEYTAMIAHITSAGHTSIRGLEPLATMFASNNTSAKEATE